jgi:hypothetical protein
VVRDQRGAALDLQVPGGLQVQNATATLRGHERYRDLARRVVRIRTEEALQRSQSHFRLVHSHSSEEALVGVKM